MDFDDVDSQLMLYGRMLHKRASFVRSVAALMLGLLHSDEFGFPEGTIDFCRIDETDPDVARAVNPGIIRGEDESGRVGFVIRFKIDNCHQITKFIAWRKLSFALSGDLISVRFAGEDIESYNMDFNSHPTKETVRPIVQTFVWLLVEGLKSGCQDLDHSRRIGFHALGD